MRAKVEHPLRVIKRQFSYVKMRFCSCAKHGTQLVTPFALPIPGMASRPLLADTGRAIP